MNLADGIEEEIPGIGHRGEHARNLLAHPGERVDDKLALAVWIGVVAHRRDGMREEQKAVQSVAVGGTQHRGRLTREFHMTASYASPRSLGIEKPAQQ